MYKLKSNMDMGWEFQSIEGQISAIARKVRGKSPKTAHTVKMTESYFLEKAILKDSSENTDYCNFQKIRPSKF